MNIKGEVEGYNDHMARARKRPRMGQAENGIKLADVGEACSFKKSLRASARGCGIPISITLFGPFRSWKYPRSFRSRRV